MARISLTADDWVTTGLRAMRDEGPSGVAVEPLAAKLGATKGSAYWHFTSRAALLEAVLQRWREVATRDVITAVEADGGDPSRRLRRLLEVVTTAVSQSPGELRLLASTDPAVKAAVEEVTAARVAYVEGLLRQAGVPLTTARRRAVLAYAAYLGFAQLVVNAPSVLPTSTKARYELMATMTDLLTV